MNQERRNESCDKICEGLSQDCNQADSSSNQQHKHIDINILYQNVRGLNTKISQIENFTDFGNCDVICLSQTWLSTNVNSDDLFFPNSFDLFRNDSQDRRGGGVLIVVNSSFNVTTIPVNFPNNLLNLFNFLALRIIRGNIKLDIVLLYLPPDLNYRTFSEIFDCLISNLQNFSHNLVILGDFNVPSFINIISI